MSAKDRLQQLQAALSKRGVRDVKFFFNKSDTKSLSECAADVVTVLDAVAAGRFKVFSGIGDSVRS